MAPPESGYSGELLRPWKLATFAFGLALLLAGAVYYRYGDWDVGISFVMGGLTYVLAPWCVLTLVYVVRERPRDAALRLAAALLAAWFVIDGVYVAYHTAVGNRMLRLDNLVTSTPLFLLCGIGWGWRGTLVELWKAVRGA